MAALAVRGVRPGEAGRMSGWTEAEKEAAWAARIRETLGIAPMSDDQRRCWSEVTGAAFDRYLDEVGLHGTCEGE